MYSYSISHTPFFQLCRDVPPCPPPPPAYFGSFYFPYYSLSQFKSLNPLSSTDCWAPKYCFGKLGHDLSILSLLWHSDLAKHFAMINSHTMIWMPGLKRLLVRERPCVVTNMFKILMSTQFWNHPHSHTNHSVLDMGQLNIYADMPKQIGLWKGSIHIGIWYSWQLTLTAWV